MMDSSSLISSGADDAMAYGLTQPAPSMLGTLAAGAGTAGAGAGARGGATGDPNALKATAQSFESVFLSQMFSQMFQDVGTDSLFGGGHGEEMFRSLMLDEYAKQVAKKGGLGIADSVMRQLIRQQEKER